MSVLSCTPAPWSLDENDCRDEAQTILSDRTGCPVGEAYLGGRGGECEANACVMAAAPELYQALRDALPLVRILLEGDLNSGCLTVDGVRDRTTADADFAGSIAACDAVLAAGEAALVKANGGEPVDLDDLDTPLARLDMVRVALTAIANGFGSPIAQAKAGLDFCNLTAAERATMRGAS